MNKARNLVEMGDFYASTVLTEAKKNFPPKDTFAVAGKKTSDAVIPKNFKTKAYDASGPLSNKNKEALAKPLEKKNVKPGQTTFTGVEKLSETPEKKETSTINTFMNKSIFDSLYEEVMNDNLDPNASEEHDAAALDLPGAGDDSDEVTITLSKELAQKLHDAIKAVIGSDEEQTKDEEGEPADTSVEDEAAEEEPYCSKCGKLKSECHGHGEDAEALPEATELEALPDSRGLSLQGKNNKVGDETSRLLSKGHGEGGKITNEPELKPVPDAKGKSLEGKNNKVASKTSKVGSYLAGLK